MKDIKWKDYFLRMKKWMFPDELKELAEKKETQAYKNLSKQGENLEEHDVKMISKYPKEQSFRFPLIEDEENEPPSISKKSMEPEKEDSVTKIEVIKKKVEKFQGQQFSVKDIPSPIHGYQQVHKKTTTKPIQEGVDTKPTQTENKHKHPLSDQPDVDSLKLHKNSEKSKQSTHVSRANHNVVQIPLKRDVMDPQPNEKAVEPVNEIDDQQMDKAMEKKHMVTHSKSNIPMNNQLHEVTKVNEIIDTNMEQGKDSFPPLSLLNVTEKTEKDDHDWLKEQTEKLNETFEFFHIRAIVVRVTKGPTVTRFEVQPEPGVKVSKIVNLTDDLKMSLSAKEIRIEAPIPGKNTIGIEVPNDVAEPVFLSEILLHPSFSEAKSPLTVAMGMSISGEPVLTDLQKMPHGLIAGSTGSGKSVCVNSILTSIIYKASPEEVRLLLIDPKMVELAPFNNVPHLAAPVITDPKEAAEGLKWAVAEMERRYQSFAEAGARDISRFNEKMDRAVTPDKKYPYLLIVVDELADLMMVSPQDVEDSICRIAQKARACGIHLLVATQRPSVDVITGLIKANIPTRIAFSVSSQADSRTILDGGGAERLLGKGDMLFLESGSSKPVRIQGTFVSDDEIDRVVDYVKGLPQPIFLFEKEELKEQLSAKGEDDLFEEACEFILEEQSASVSLLQRHFRMGYNRAARLIDDMEARGIVSSSRGSKPRDVYLTKHD